MKLPNTLQKMLLTDQIQSYEHLRRHATKLSKIRVESGTSTRRPPPVTQASCEGSQRRDKPKKDTIYRSLTKRLDIIHFAWFHSGYCNLRQYQYRFKRAEDSNCDSGDGSIENIKHYLLSCRKYDRQRAKLRERDRRDVHGKAPGMLSPHQTYARICRRNRKDEMLL